MSVMLTLVCVCASSKTKVRDNVGKRNSRPDCHLLRKYFTCFDVNLPTEAKHFHNLKHRTFGTPKLLLEVVSYLSLRGYWNRILIKKKKLSQKKEDCDNLPIF